MQRKVIIDREEEIHKGLRRTTVVLEDLSVQKESRDVLAIIGRIRVANLAFGKFVFARVTFNNWSSYRDYSATHTESSVEGSDDTFAFGFTRRDKRPVYVEFALCCVQNGQEYWDNNGGKNYCFHLREDPFSDPELEQTAEPEIVTTWQVAEENSPQQEEIIFDTSSYPHFQAHPLTPTKIHLYTSFREVPEKQILPARVEDSRHVHAYNALALESLLIIEESPQQNGSEEIQATSVGAVESGVDMGISEQAQSNIDEIQTVDSKMENIVEEDAVEPILIVKPVDEDTQDEIFDKLTQERGDITIDLQIIEEPGTEDLSNDKRNDSQQTAERNGVIDEQEQNDTTLEATTKADIDDAKDEEGHQQQKEAKKDEKKKKGKKDKKNSKEDKHDRNSSSEMEKRDDHSDSSRKEKIEDEASPKKPKKSFLSRMACCGKAEPD